MRILSIAPALAASAITTSLIAVPVLAADYPVLRGSQIEETPVLMDRFSWTGFYFGGLAGTSRTEFQTGENGLQPQFQALRRGLQISQGVDILGTVRFNNRSDSGMSYGGFAGYNVAFGDAIIGLEADYNRHDHQYASAPINLAAGAGTVSLLGTQTLEDYGSLRVRFGYAIGRLMPYASLGFAVGRGTSTVSFLPDAATGLSPAFARSKNTYTSGFTGGLGVDAAVTDNLILRAEYVYTRFADLEGTVVDINNVRVGAGVKF
ncbi:outer membrane protein [Bosea sp. BH3]|uniref:outer membrane protein n=1 Tax=Bosea sp. BH3 TaxID=2871701 RepID=UPI0021CB05BB|nr:outer membrane beta-barrel protein [Bosea sp. BH3]MCU4182115.1 outer membrane beta-barrel protein [Bosea sp. BH3]